ncbi:MAG: hypothetical protein M1820_008015 [Bogoriella megaspora]|nr:MAG: hypothetical protein M1820_008015 [Bogoriella megaspora]
MPDRGGTPDSTKKQQNSFNVTRKQQGGQPQNSKAQSRPTHGDLTSSNPACSTPESRIKGGWLSITSDESNTNAVDPYDEDNANLQLSKMPDTKDLKKEAKTMLSERFINGLSVNPDVIADIYMKEWKKELITNEVVDRMKGKYNGTMSWALMTPLETELRSRLPRLYEQVLNKEASGYAQAVKQHLETCESELQELESQHHRTTDDDDKARMMIADFMVQGYEAAHYVFAQIWPAGAPKPMDLGSISHDERIKVEKLKIAFDQLYEARDENVKVQSQYANELKSMAFNINKKRKSKQEWASLLKELRRRECY